MNKQKSRISNAQTVLRVGVVQLTSGEDVEANVRHVFYELEQLKSSKCDLICLPENALFLRIDKNKRQAFDLKEDFWSQFQDFSRENKCSIMVGSVPIRRGKKCTNSTVFIAEGSKPKVVYDKIHLFDVDVKGAPPARESAVCHYGRQPQMIKLKGWSIGLSICYDVRFSELYLKYARKGVDLILIPAAFLVPTGQAHWHTLMRARAIESQSYVVAAAQCGGHLNKDNLRRETYGHSLAVGPWGEVLADLGNNGSGSVVLELDLNEIKKVRAQIPMSEHRRLK